MIAVKWHSMLETINSTEWGKKSWLLILKHCLEFCDV